MLKRLAGCVAAGGLAAAAFLVGSVPVAAGNILEVPVAYPSIQAAINAANNGDTVLVDPGTYFENIDFLGKPITVQSAQGPSVTTIDGGRVAPVVNFSHGETSAAVLQGFTIRNGNATGSYQYVGGGVHMVGASATVIGNVITSNVTCAGGGGISIQGGSPLIQDNTISGNSILGCSGAAGGGIEIQSFGSAQIVHNVITNNSSDWGGGIALNSAGTPTLRANTISNNSTRQFEGGGIYAVNQSDALIVQNLITGNTSAGSGGAAYISPPSGTRGAFLVNNTFANNTGSDSSVFFGGFDSQVEFVNNIVSATGLPPAVLCSTTYSATPPVIDHNDLFNVNGPSVQGSCGSVVGTSGNISADPQFVSSNDAHLQTTSPAVDAGNNSAPSLPTTDLDGNPRIWGPTVDLGVYEVQSPPLTLTSDNNRPPAFEGAPYSAVLAHFVGGRYPFSATVDWGDGQTSAATISGGAISGTHTYAEEGGYNVTVTVTDSTGATSSGKPAMSAQDAPLSGNGTQAVTIEAGSFSGVLGTFQDADPGGTLNDYTATIDWRDGTTTAGTIAIVAGAIQVSGAHTYAEEGSYGVSVVLTDIGGAFWSVGPQITVQDAPLSSSGTQPMTSVEGSTYSGNLASFSDSDPNGTLSDYTGNILWGDNTSSFGTITPDGTGGYIVSASHTYLEEGSFTIQVFPFDTGGAGAPVTDTVTVADAPLASSPGPSLSGTESATVSGVLATFTDSDPNASASDYKATVDWGDGTTSAGTIAANGSGGFSVSGSHVYEEGSYQVKVTITDAGASTTVTTSAVIGDAPVSGTGKQSLQTVEAGTFSDPVATFSDADPSAIQSDYTATIDWGDHTTSSGVVSEAAPTSIQVSGTHSYAEEGDYSVTVTLTDIGGAAATATSPMHVGDAQLSATAITFSATEGTAFSGNVASFTDTDPNGTLSDYTGTIIWGDGTSSSGTVTSDGHGGYILSGSHTYFEEGTYTVTPLPADIGAGSNPISMTVTVGDAPLSSSPGATLNATEGASVSGIVANFDDPAPSGTGWTATIYWGDQTTSAGTIATSAFGGFTVSGTHTYAEEGTYKATVTITDDGGATTTTATNVSISDAAIALAGTQLSVKHGTNFTATVANLSDADPAGAAADYSGTIAWGDGSTTSCPSAACKLVLQSNGTFSVSAAHRYDKKGRYTVLIQFKDAGGATAQAAAIITAS